MVFHSKYNLPLTSQRVYSLLPFDLSRSIIRAIYAQIHFGVNTICTCLTGFCVHLLCTF